MASLEDHLRNIGEDSDQDHDEGPPSNVPAPVSDGLPQTGPKGVLTDYYRKMEEDKQLKVQADQKCKNSIIEHSATVTTHSEDAAEAAAMADVAKGLDDCLLENDPFMMEYRAKRMQEMKRQASIGGGRKRFGNFVEVRGDRYAHLIDNSPPGVMLIIHLYSEVHPDCLYLNKSLTRLAKLYPTAKFCRVQSCQLGVSESFEKNGLPALMAYFEGRLMLNQVRVTDVIGTEYTDEDLEDFLQKNKCLPHTSEKEDPQFSGRMIGASKILGMSSGAKDSDDSD